MQRVLLTGLTLVLAVLATSAQAQAFPEGAASPTADEIKARLSGTVFSVALADGNSWRLQYAGNGYFYVDTNKGFRATGEWQAEDGRLCGQLRGRDRTCNDVRVHQGVLHYKRDSGEIVQFIPR
jgi:hypothetical protein